MGSRRLPRAKAVRALAAAFALVLAACSGGEAKTPATPSPGATGTVAAPTGTSTAPLPSPTSTPDPLSPPPATPEAALASLRAYLPGRPPCPPEIERTWAATCTPGNLDGDAITDAVYAIPLASGGALPAPAVVVAWRGSNGELAAFPEIGAADLGALGRALFAVADRTGDARVEVMYLATACGAHTCTSRLEIQSWDGSAWRDAGPGDQGIATLERATTSGSGTATEVVLHGGVIQSVGAGPPRQSTTTYRWNGARYAVASVVPDAPQYLIHAILDADALFASGRYPEAAIAYVSAAERTDLKDWQAEIGAGDGRGRLTGYARFRAAVAIAASGADATAAFDAAIARGTEQAFITATEAFRKGLKEGGSVHAGCLEATRYLTSPGVPAYLRLVFDYGYANPQKTAAEICPL